MHRSLSRRRTGRKSRSTSVERSRGNVFADLGMPDADLLLAKSELAARISAILSARELTQAEAARVLGIDQPGVSELVRGNLRRFSSDRLFRFLNSLGQDIDIVILKRAPSRMRAGRLRVRDGGIPRKPAA